MPKLYVANCTRQRQSFIYRLPEHPSTREQTIEIGHQILVSGDLNTKQVEAIIDQYRPYGMIAASEKPPQGFVGLVYSVDKPITSTPIHDLIVHNTEVMTDIGRRARQDAAVAFENMAQNNIRQYGNDKDRVNELEVDINEQPTSFGDRSEKLHEQTLVVREGANAPTPRGRGKRRAA